MAKQGNRFRIIAGDWRGRMFSFPDGEGLRPTGDRVRETLFNWLQFDIVGARCLDAFAGSGALGLEALSRGATEVYCLETASAALQSLEEHARALGSGRLTVRRESALDFLARPAAGQTRFDCIFLDPPFADNYLETCCGLIADHDWLSPGGHVYLEYSSPLDTLGLPEGWVLQRSKRAGKVHYGLVRKEGDKAGV